MIRGKLHRKLQLYEVHYEGDIFLQDIIDFIHKLGQNKDLPSRLKTISFATTANFKFKHSDLRPIVEASNCISEKFDSFREAFIVNSPKSTVLVTTFKLMNVSSGSYRMEIFSTKEAALRWQGIDSLDLERY